MLVENAAWRKMLSSAGTFWRSFASARRGGVGIAIVDATCDTDLMEIGGSCRDAEQTAVTGSKMRGATAESGSSIFDGGLTARSTMAGAATTAAGQAE